MNTALSDLEAVSTAVTMKMNDVTSAVKDKAGGEWQAIIEAERVAGNYRS